MNFRWKNTLTFILLTASLVSACAPLYPTPKGIDKGTSTPTPFLPKATFTPTLENPPTVALASSFSSPPQDTAAPTDTATAAQTTPEPTPTPGITPSVTISPLPATHTPTQAATAAPTNTPKPGKPVVSVSVSTNCRTGPGTSYPRVGSLLTWQTAKLIARHPDLDYWYIQLPENGRHCWLWGYYASPSGSYQDLPVFTPPPPPTSGPSSTPTLTKTAPDITPSSTPKPTKTPTKTKIPPSATPGSPPPPSPTSPPTNTPQPTDPPTPTNTPRPATATYTPRPPTATPTPRTKYCSHTTVLSGDEEEIKSLINEARVDHGLPPLQTNWNLKIAARDHGRDMTCNHMSGHNSSDGTQAWVRIARALGHYDTWCWDNWACTEIWSGHSSPESAFWWWMNHESQDPNYDDNIHKRMILHERMTHLGVGAIYYNDGSTVRKYYTVDFARP